MSYADSTVAMTAYNLLAVSGGESELGKLRDVVVACQFPSLKQEQFDRAVLGLEERGGGEITTAATILREAAA